ncbi:hypothetical protein GQ42DRAFT_176658 [Ramicandelaber brevisporus]|nr:hypothetical protein GQ42DRAFT_176658 [Ramicandelaber brevisporus]
MVALRPRKHSVAVELLSRMVAAPRPAARLAAYLAKLHLLPRMRWAAAVRLPWAAVASLAPSYWAEPAPWLRRRWVAPVQLPRMAVLEAMSSRRPNQLLRVLPVLFLLPRMPVAASRARPKLPAVHLLDKSAERLPERLPERLQERLPERLQERLPERLHQQREAIKRQPLELLRRQPPDPHQRLPKLLQRLPLQRLPRHPRRANK